MRRFGFLMLIVFSAYLPMMWAGFIWDDPEYVTENNELRTLTGLGRIWFSPNATPQYYPLVFTTFWIEYQLWNLHPLGYHFNNVLLHVLNSFLVYRILSRLQIPDGAALIAATLFAVHPVHVESVAWITERKNVLSGFFYLLSFLFYWKFDESRRNPVSSRWKGWEFYGVALVCFGCALLSKSVTASLPAAILVVIWWKEGRFGARQLLSLLPFFVAGILAGLHTAHLETEHVGAEGAEWDWTPWERCLIAGRAIWFYATKLVWPYPLIFIYPKWQIDSNSLLQTLYPVLAILVPIILATGQKRWGRGPLAAVLLFGGTLIPALGFVNVYPMRFSFVADHFQYLASIGILSLLAVFAHRFASYWKMRLALQYVVTGVVMLSLSALTFIRCFDYRDAETLWTRTMRDDPSGWFAISHVAHIKGYQKKYSEAIDLFELTLRRKPKESCEPAEMADMHLRIAACYDAVRDPSNAEKHRRTALDYLTQLIGDKFQDQFAVYMNIGAIHRSFGQTEDAVDAFQKALEIQPGNTETLFEIGTTYLRNKQFDESLNYLRKALPDQRRNPHLHYHMALAYYSIGDLTSARRHVEEALILQPNFGFAQALFRQILTKEAEGK